MHYTNKTLSRIAELFDIDLSANPSYRQYIAAKLTLIFIVFAALVAIYLFCLLAHRVSKHSRIRVLRALGCYFGRTPTSFGLSYDVYTIECPYRGNPLKQKPMPYRPFRIARHVALGIHKVTMDEWIQVDQTYLARMQLRHQLFNQDLAECLQCSEGAAGAVRELYEILMTTYLPKRFPTLFKLKGDLVKNSALCTNQRLSTGEGKAGTLLRTIGENIEEDIYLMSPPTTQHDDEYTLQAFVACFPSGFSPLAKFGKPMSEIHGPVPGYEGRLRKGVNRFFARLKPGEIVERFNVCQREQSRNLEIFGFDRQQWSVQPNDATLQLTGSLPSATDKAIEPLSSHLRVERQTLMRLPSGFIVFGVHTYMTLLPEIEAEGLGLELAGAIDSIPEKLAIYKNQPYWGPTITAWLRREQAPI